MNTGSEPSFLGRCWRAVRRLVLVFITLAGLVTIFYVVENWRGRHAWKKHRAELTARGERLELTDYAVAPVPAEQNFTQTSVLRAITYRGNMDTNLFAKFEWVRKGLTNFPVGTESVLKENAAEVLGAFGRIEKEMAELRTAAKRPYAQFPKTNDNAFLAEVPNFVMLRTLSQLFTIHASAELAAGHSDRALADIAVVQRLADALGGKATLVEAMIRVSLLGLTLRPFEDGLASGAWTDEQLAAWQKNFESAELLVDLDVALRGGERNSLTHFAVKMPRPYLVDVLRSFGVLNAKDYFFEKAVRWCPEGWLYQNAVYYSRVMQRQFGSYDVKQQRIFPEKSAAAISSIDKEVKAFTPFKYLMAVGVPNFSRAMQSTGQQQAYLQEAALACALERYRRARGEYPETLAALVPQFTTKLPTDLMTGAGLKYQRAEKDKFSLYSVGWNLQDDGGVSSTNRLAGDWAWPPARL